MSVLEQAEDRAISKSGFVEILQAVDEQDDRQDCQVNLLMCQSSGEQLCEISKHCRL